MLTTRDIYSIKNKCHWPLMHYPYDLCHWDSVTGEDGYPKTIQYQDDGFGNLIPLPMHLRYSIRKFIFGGN